MLTLIAALYVEAAALCLSDLHCELVEAHFEEVQKVCTVDPAFGCRDAIRSTYALIDTLQAEIDVQAEQAAAEQQTRI